MGLLGPMVMGVLGQQQRANGLDAQGLTQLLQSQKGNIARALPPGFADYLSSAGLLDRTANQTVKDPAWRALADQSPQWNWVVPKYVPKYGASLKPPGCIKTTFGYLAPTASAGSWYGEPAGKMSFAPC